MVKNFYKFNTLSKISFFLIEEVNGLKELRYLDG
jgi:hypothetical protein